MQIKTDNPIRKKFMRLSYNFNTGKIISMKEWVAQCPKCSNTITAGMNMGMYGITGNSRKTAKDALYRHLRFDH